MARITYRKTRRGETITMRADKGEDLRDVIIEMAKPITRGTVECRHNREIDPDTGECADCGTVLP